MMTKKGSIKIAVDAKDGYEWVTEALLRTLYKNETLTQEQKEDFCSAFENELDNGQGLILWEY